MGYGGPKPIYCSTRCQQQGHYSIQIIRRVRIYSQDPIHHAEELCLIKRVRKVIDVFEEA